MKTDHGDAVELRLDLGNVMEVLLQEISDRHITRDGVAITYATAIAQGIREGFGEANAAIIARWSEAGLHYIKNTAWRLVESRGGAK